MGSAIFLLGEHLKAAKNCCKLLNRQGFGNIQQKTADALTHLENVQSQLLSNPSDTLFRQEHVARKKWIFFAAALESLYKQKSRIRWLNEGDANTSFFHRVVIANQSRNLIKYLRDHNDERVENVSQLKEMIVSYYTNLLGSESEATQPYTVDQIQSLHPFRCDTALASQLTAILSAEEITRTVSSMPRNKASGPDGFPVEFFWDSWTIIKDGLVAAVQDLSTSLLQ